MVRKKIDPRKRKHAEAQVQLGGLLFAAAEGDTHALNAEVEAGCDLKISDYDARTALHLAASEGQSTRLSSLWVVQVTVLWMLFLVEAAHIVYAQGCSSVPLSTLAGTVTPFSVGSENLLLLTTISSIIGHFRSYRGRQVYHQQDRR
jgi:hypothetical protein